MTRERGDAKTTESSHARTIKVLPIGDFLVQVDSDEHLEILEPDVATRSGRERTGVDDRLLDAAKAIRSTIRSACELVLDAFERANRPDELKVKFGIKVGGEAGIPYLTKGSAS